MEIVTWKEALSRHKVGLGALCLLDNSHPMDARNLRTRRRFGQPLTDYVGLCAVEKDQVVSRVAVDRPQWTSPTGVETVSSVNTVFTRPDATRLGYAKALFGELHTREREAGIRLVFLWTQRSWGAHALYERLGYHDVYSHPSAVGIVPRRGNRPARGYSARVGRKTDTALLQDLLEQGTRGRLGFVPRFPGSFKLWFAMGWWRPEEYHILSYHGEDVGYAYAKVDERRVLVFEALVTQKDHLWALLDLLEELARGKWLYLESTTVVSDAGEMLRRRGQLVIPQSHSVLMVKSLGDPRGSAAVKAVCEDPRFSCHTGDRF